jgi:hypothetical protein
VRDGDQEVAFEGRARVNYRYSNCGLEEKMSGGSLHPSSLGSSKNKGIDKRKEVDIGRTDAA